MSAKHVALIAETEREIADRFEHYGIADPADKAAALVRWIQGKGWRVHPALSESPPPPHRARPEVQAQAMNTIRAALRKDGAR